MSRWDSFPYVVGGKALAKKPILVQILVCSAIAIPLIILGLISTQRWALVLGALWLVVPLVSLCRLFRASR